MPRLSSPRASFARIAIILLLLTSEPVLAQSPAGIINTVIGGQNGDNGPASDAIFDPEGIEFRGQDLYIADFKGARVRKIDGASGIMATAKRASAETAARH
jgi:hypothetical protein